jgi:hypothetical protein
MQMCDFAYTAISKFFIREEIIDAKKVGLVYH